MRLSQLADAIAPTSVVNQSANDLEVVNIAESLDDVCEGSVFCAIRGTRVDGHDLVPQAIELGAVGLIVEREVEDVDAVQLVVPSVRAAIGPAAAALLGNPANKLRLIGITGTNGKTTTAHIASHLIESSGMKVAVIGTLSGAYTSPPPAKLQQMLSDFVDQGVEVVVMEVSSHALDQHRVAGLHFEVGVFTNLSQDHLDYHETMDAYFDAKAKLFTAEYSSCGVVNLDDARGKQLFDRGGIPLVGYSFEDAHNVTLSSRGASFVWNDNPVSISLVGQFNVMNCLSAMETTRQFGLDDQQIVEGLKTLTPVPGRVESIDCGQPFSVFVDFAHTPDGLEKVLTSTRPAVGDGAQLIAVFGCGGDRDVQKRPLMAKVVEQNADLIVLTSDNPRSENPAAIAQDALAGINNKDVVHVELDRARAIKYAIDHASNGDVVLIAGKGHETTQEIRGQKFPFDDREVARASIHDRNQEQTKTRNEDYETQKDEGVQR